MRVVHSSSLRRSQRLLNRPLPLPECTTSQNHPIRRIVYVLGDLPEEDLTEWGQILHDFHTDDVLQDKVDDVLRSAQHYLQWRTSECGQSYAASRHIPRRSTFCYYSGALTTHEPATRSKHRITMGPLVGGFHTRWRLMGVL